MFGYSLYGSKYGESPALVSVIGGNIQFNGYNLQTENIITNKITVDSFPYVDYEDYSLPRADGMGFLSKFYRSRNIEITGFLKHETEFDLQVLIDSLKGNLTQTSGIFKYIANGEYRQISGTCIDLQIIKEHYNITVVPFSIQIKTLESYFYLSNNLSTTDSSSASPRTIQINNGGSAVSLPQAYLTFTGVSGTNSVAFALNNRTLTYTGTIATNDILLFDCLNKQVLKNGTLVEYSGTFPQLEIGSNSLVFTKNGTSTCAYSITYRKNFI